MVEDSLSGLVIQAVTTQDDPSCGDPRSGLGETESKLA